MAIGQTEELDGEFAAVEVLKQCADALLGETPQAGLLLASHDLDYDPFLAAIHGAYPDLELIGCTTMAPMSSASAYAEGSTTLTLFASDVLDFTTGIGSGVASGETAATAMAISQAAAKTQKEPALLITVPTIEHVDPSMFIDTVGSVLGRAVPVFGGGASPNLPVAMPWLGSSQFYGTSVMTDSLPVLLISGPLAWSFGVAHGWGPVGKESVITRAIDNRVYEIDGEPILEFYQRYLGIGTEPAIANPLAMLDADTGRFVLRAPMEYDKSDGSATFFGSIPEGAVVQLTMANHEEILRGAEASIAEAKAGLPEGSTVEAVLIASCAVRSFLLGSRTEDEIERIRTGIGYDVPVSGFYAFGEIAPLGSDSAARFHNETCVTVVLGT